MAAQVGALRVSVGADITGLQTGMRRAERQVAQSAGVMQKSVASVNAAFTGLGTVAGVTLGGAGVLAAGSAFLRVADAAKSLQAQLKLATAEFGSLEKANKDVRAIAESTRSDLLATAELYAALQRNSGQLGTTQEQVARATQTVAEAFKVSGAATSEQSAATRQLIQAFQSGVLRGDEFNSVMENAPRLARLLADSLGVTVGELRAMAQEGELTADKLVRAFTDKRFTDGIDAEFKQLPVTFDQAMGQVYNAAIIVFSAFDRGGQFSTSLANFVSDGTDGFEQLEQRAYHFGQQVADTFGAIEEVRSALNSLNTDGIGAFIGLTNATYGWRDALADTLGVIDGVANAFANLFNAPGNLIRVGMGNSPILNPFDMRGKFLDSAQKRDMEAARARIMGRSFNDVLAEAGFGKKPPPFRPPSGGGKARRSGGGVGAKRAPEDRSAEVEAQFDAQILQAKQNILNAQRSLSRDAAQRAQISLQILDLERVEQEIALNDSVRRAEKDRADGKITQTALENVKADADILRAKYDEINDLKKQDILREEEARLRQEAADLQDTKINVVVEQLQAEDALATTAREHRAIQLRILEYQHKLERLALERVLADQDATEAAKEEARVRLAALDARQAAERAGVEASNRNPIEQWAATVPQSAAEINEALESIAAQGLDNLSDALTQVLMGTKDLKSAFHELAASILADLLKMTIKMLLFKALQAAMGGGTDFGAIAGSMNGQEVPVNFGGGRAVGGPVSPGTTYLVGERGPELFTPGRSGSIVPNDALGGGGMSLTFHNDFRGADPSAVAAIQVRLNQMEAEIPSKVLATMSDARDRFVWRGQ